MGEVSEANMIRSRRQRRVAVTSVALGATAVICGLALMLLVAQGTHLQPSGRRAFWNAMWAWRLLPPAVALAVLALVGAGLVARGARLAGGTARILAIAGLVLALWPWLPRARPYRAGSCLSNVKNIALAFQMYLTDCDAFPPSEHWADAMFEYTRNRDLYRCPDRQGIFGYAYNAALNGFPGGTPAKLARVPVIFESDRGWNAYGGKELLPDFARHFGGDNLGFADGHAKWYAREKPPDGVRWDSVWPREYQEDDELQWQPASRRRAR